MKEFSIKKILTNPLVWIGLTLTYFTIQHESDGNIYNIFLSSNTYHNLFIGSGIYVAFFNTKYTKNHNHVDYIETIRTCIETMFIILFIWLFCISLYAGFHEMGDMYSRALRAKYSHMQP